MRRYIERFPIDEPILEDPIPVNKACTTLTEAVKTNAANIIFTRLIRGESKIDGEGFSGNLEDLLNIPTSQYSLEQLKWLASFFSGGAIFKRYQRILEQLAPSDELKRTELLGIVNGIASLESFKANYIDKIFEIGNAIISIGPKGLGYSLETHEEIRMYTNLLHDLGFAVNIFNNDRKYLGIPYWSSGKDAQGNQEFTKFTLPGVESIHGVYSQSLDSHGKPISGKFQTDKTGLSIPFWTEEGKYKIFPGISGIDLQGIREINFSSETRKNGVLRTWNYTKVYFWTNGKTGDYTTISKWEGEKVIELEGYNEVDENGTPGEVTLKREKGRIVHLIRQKDGTFIEVGKMKFLLRLFTNRSLIK